MAKIAVDVAEAVSRRLAQGVPGGVTMRPLARGDGWLVEDALCTSGPWDRRYEESYRDARVAVVVAGSFQYRSASEHHLMMPGALMLGREGQSFECGHEHAAGDRCVSFAYAPGAFERIAADAGAPAGRRRFRAIRVPPLRALSTLVARTCAGLAGAPQVAWDELAVQLAACAVQLEAGLPPEHADPAPSTVARVTRVVREIERDPAAALSLDELARRARLSPYHFLRTFQQVTGVTPHQYVLRVRLRESALRLAAEATNVLDVALDCGFGDVSNFNRAFRAEFGLSPRAYRAQMGQFRIVGSRPSTSRTGPRVRPVSVSVTASVSSRPERRPV